MIPKLFVRLSLTLLALLILMVPSLPANASLPANVNQNDLPEARSWSDFRYIFVAGSTMRPRASATTWSYPPGAGCVSTVTGDDLFTIHLQLPQGSRIDYLRIFFYDTSANNSRAWITRYNAGGGFSDLISVDSFGTAGYGSTLSPYIGHVVDNFNNAYVLNFRANQTGTTMSLCGLRVAYRVPLESVYLPLILK